MIVQFIRPHRQPEYFPPVLSRNGAEFTASNTELNGDYAEGFSVYADGKLLASGEFVDGKYSFNYYDHNFKKEYLHKFKAEVNASETFRKSKASNVEECGEIEAPRVYIDGNYLVIVNNSKYATKFDVYVNGVFVKSTTGTRIALTDLYSGGYGLYEFKACAKNDDNKWFDSVQGDDAKLGNAPPLSVARAFSAGGSVGEYYVFAGGHNGEPTDTNAVTDVEAYNCELIKTSVTALPNAYYTPVAASVGDKLLICGWCNSDNKCYVVPYDDNLTRLTALERSIAAKVGIMSGSIGNYALFAGGKDNAWGYVSTVDVVDTSLTVTKATALTKHRYSGASANAGNYLLFAGGYSLGQNSETAMDTVDAYSNNLTLTAVTPLPDGRALLAGASAGTNALFAAGMSNGYINNNVTGYNKSLTRIDTVSAIMGNSYTNTVGARLSDCAVFAGGKFMDFISCEYAIFSPQLAYIEAGVLSTFGYSKSIASINDVALVTSGYCTEVNNIVDVVCLN